MEPIIDRGEVILYSREDLSRLENYLGALAQGREDYKPEGLTIQERTEPAPVIENNPLMAKPLPYVKTGMIDRNTHRYGQQL